MIKQTYLAYDGINYKIGTSIDSEKRINNCKTANPNIELLVYGYGIKEKALHNLYEEKRVDREWFNLDNQDVHYITEQITRVKTEPFKETEMPDNTNEITERLNDILKHYNLKRYSDFAEKTGLSHQVCSNYLKGKQKPDAEKLAVIIDSFEDINARWLLTGKGDMIESIEYNTLDNIDYKKLIKRTGLNQQEFADSIGVSLRSVSNWVKGEFQPTTAVFRKLNDMYGHLINSDKEEECKEGLDGLSHLEIVEHIAKNFDEYKNLELFKMLIHINKLDNIDL